MPSHEDYLAWKRQNINLIYARMDMAFREYREMRPQLEIRSERKYMDGVEEHSDENIFELSRDQFKHHAWSEWMDLENYIGVPLYLASLRFRK